MRNYLYIFAFSFFLPLFASAQGTVEYNMFMRNTGYDTMWDGQVMRTWGFAYRLLHNVPIPSPTLYANEGDTVIIRVKNVSQGDPHTIHLHGLDVDQANDGVPMTSFALHHMDDSSYRFIASHAGTYIYHCHVLSVVHVQMGMYGSLIVRAKDAAKTVWTNGPSFTKEYNWLMSEADKSWHDHVPGGNNGHADTGMHDTVTIPKYIPDYFLVNGKSVQEIKADTSVAATGEVGDTLYIRLTNVGYTYNEVIFPPYLNATLVESDGRPLPNSLRMDSIRVLPGERYGVLLYPNKVIEDSVRVKYRNMNNRSLLNTQYIPLSISPASSVDERQFNRPGFFIYPNPASESFYIDPLQLNIRTVSIHDHTGRQILTSNYAKGNDKLEINADRLSAGIYIVSIIAEQGSYSRQLIISK